MSKFLIYIKLECYLKQWLENSFGSPVTFPPGSNENSIIKRFVSKLPDGKLPDSYCENFTSICIPDNRFKSPEYYNYLGPCGKRLLISSIEDLFRMSMWNELNRLVDINHGGVNSVVAAWCEFHGIDEVYTEAVRQKYYRMRVLYSKKGIILQSFCKKDYDVNLNFVQLRTTPNNTEQS